MKGQRRKAGPGTGVLTGLLLTFPLVAILFAGWRALGLPFAPFDVFDWLTRVLPGGLITFGIDSMVKVIRILGLADTASAAKAAEQTMAIGALLVAGAVGGALLFAVLRPPARRGSVAAGLVLGAVAGVVVLVLTHALGWRARVDPVTGGAWTLAAFLAWGASVGWSHRRLSPETGAPAIANGEARVERVSRRQFMVRLGGAAATITVVGAAVGAIGSRRRRPPTTGRRWSTENPLPNAGADVEPAYGTRPELTPLENHYRIDINTSVPSIDEKSWRLKIGGLVDRPLELTLPRIRDYEPLHQFVTLACVSNPLAGSLISTTRWTGVSLQRLLPDLRLAPNATHLKLSAADGFHEVVALEKVRADERVMLTYAWDGLPLAAKHGFPLRIYIPDVYGMKQPKWLRSIEALDHWEEGYWVRRGWDRTAQMKATSVIDTVAVDMMLSQATGTTRIPVGGIAHAGARGISRIEVRVDDGPWYEARLRTPLSKTTWMVWRYDWAYEPGEHTFAVRCFDGAGGAQPDRMAPPHPSGAAGIHTKSVML